MTLLSLPAGHGSNPIRATARCPLQKEETLTTPSRPAVLKRPALAAALASLSLGVIATASEPTTPPLQSAQPVEAARADGSAFNALFEALASDKPLFLVQGTDPTTRDFDEDDAHGVQKYPMGGFFGIDSDHSDTTLRIGAFGQFRGNLDWVVATEVLTAGPNLRASKLKER